MNVKFINLKNEIQKNFYPVVSIEGEDAYLRGKAVEIIRENLNIVLPDINISSFTDDSSVEDILYACESLPFGSVKKMVIADFSNTAKAAFNSAERERLQKYFVNPNEYCCLAFITAQKNDLFKSEKILNIDCGKLEKNSLIKWVKSKFISVNKSIADDAAETLIEYCLFDMTRISAETEKLISYSNNITIGDVNALVHKDIEYQIFDLSTYISAKKGDAALETLEQMLKSGEEATGLLALLYNFYRRMYYISVSADSDAEIANKLNIKEYAITKTRSVLSKYTPLKLKNALAFFETAEVNIKKTWGKDGEQLRLTVLKLLNL
ncbi:MAG TPA: DNA polymerase III subunit delta [Eubacteriales bacterium]|nr:DNA polymerase III subunit delta [Eubacteriales bacterium]